jgi:hypothetical protein
MEKAAARRKSVVAEGDGAMQELDELLPDDIKNRGIWWGNELLLPFSEALKAVETASLHGIAILGIEAFEVQKESLLTVDMADASAHTPFRGDWLAYVQDMNKQAEVWIRGHRFGENHGYILSSASEKEFAALHNPWNSPAR